jgi:Kinesin-associated protein (KAP)
VKDDLVLETVVFLGTCACDESCAMLLCKADIMISLIELLKAKQEDDEIVLQIVFVFQQVLRNESTRSYMIKETETPAYLIDLMHDKNSEIRAVCDFCLDVIATVDNNWASRIKLEKFRNHNSQWLDMVESQQTNEEETPDFGPLDDEDEDGVPPYYMNQYSMDMINDSNDELESNARTNSGLSNHSRPISRYSRDLEDIEIINTNDKLRQPDGDGFYNNNIINSGNDNIGHLTEPYLVS